MSAAGLSLGVPTPPERTDIVSERDQLRAQARLLTGLDGLVPSENINYVKTRALRDGHGLRHISHVAALSIDGYRYAFRFTEPAMEYGGSEGEVVAMIPGFTENPFWGTARGLHNDVVTENPTTRTVSVCNDGYSKHGTAITLRNIGRSFADMARGRAALLGSLGGDSPTMVAGTSKGSVLAILAAGHNLEEPRFNHQLSVFHSPAVVPPNRILPDMVVRFPVHIVLDIIRESSQHPVAAAKALHLPSLRVLPAYACDVYNLLHGTPEQTVDTVAAETSVGIIAGDRDPLSQLAMWQRIAERHPDNVHILTKLGQGHGSSLNSREAAEDIQEVRNALLAKKALAALGYNATSLI